MNLLIIQTDLLDTFAFHSFFSPLQPTRIYFLYHRPFFDYITKFRWQEMDTFYSMACSLYTENFSKRRIFNRFAVSLISQFRICTAISRGTETTILSGRPIMLCV